MLAAVHAAATKTGLDDEAYRDMLAAQTGKRSAKDCTDQELAQVLSHLSAASPAFKPSARADVRKIYALWGELKRRGKATNPTAGGLRALVSKMAQLPDGVIKSPDFLTPAEAATAIEALKAMVER